MEAKNDAIGDGDCIKVACDNLITSTLPNLIFCYAYVMGQGKLKGQRILHAWNEFQDLVFDFSNGKHTMVRKEIYYETAQIKEKDVIKSGRRRTLNLLLKYKIYGGWIK